MKHHPFFSLPGCITALIFVAAMLAATAALGGVLFSPGALSAQGAERAPLRNFKSHAEFEGRCEFCHSPWLGVTADLCEACHVKVADERRTTTGVHGVLKQAHACQMCHSEHAGRQADQTAKAMLTFPHEQTGYSLVKHQRWPDGDNFSCRDCHSSTDSSYIFEPSSCDTCHQKLDSVFVEKHIAKYSADCLACHHQLDPFDHLTFQLIGGHAQVRCDRCHTTGDFTQAKADCITCHADPEIHRGMFGTDCAACHTITAWSPAQLKKHTFPIDHGGEGEIACATCHTKTYQEYTCYNCHAHNAEEDRVTHMKAGLLEFSDCMKCHADGKTHEQ
jgi:hypothetical protein